jgi:hypothetical protein
LSATELSGDGTFTVDYDFNDEFPRMAMFRLVNDVDSRCDTVWIKQKGLIEAQLSMSNTAMVVAGAGGEEELPIETNVSIDDMTVDITYSEDAQNWITNVDIRQSSADETQQLVLTTAENTSSDYPRTAVVNLSFTDGWGASVSQQINVTQRNSRETLGVELSFNEARKLATVDGVLIDDFVLIDGIVISDKSSGNAGENEETTATTIDYTGAKKTLYLESEDGKYGFCVIMDSETDNVFERYNHVQFLLRGATITKKTLPERYVITGVTSSMVTSNVAGSASDVPTKERYMNELSDADIYTWVTLKDCEFPIRKGALCPVNEAYTIASNTHRLSKYPILIRDIHGDDMYVYTNTTCTYRNDGSRLPYGSGKISGVLVHEKFIRFVSEDAADEEDFGNIGTYQLRHMSKDDIQFNSDFEDSFSALLTEYRFQNSNYDGTAVPTYGTNGWLTHTYQQKYTHDKNLEYTYATYKVHFFVAGEWCYLGPIGNGVNPDFGKHVGNENGCGIILDLTKEHYNSNMSAWVSHNPDGTVEWAGPYATNSACKTINNQSSSLMGKGNVGAACFTTFSSNYWWNQSTNRGYAWMINFSTEGIQTDQLSMQISVLNNDQNFYKPRYWKAEWSTVDSMDEEDDDKWQLIGEYEVPDLSIGSNTLTTTMSGYKYINFRLPLEMLGHKNVYVRLMPRNAKASSGGGYADSFIYEGKTGAQASALGYFAIRYNK